MNDKVNVRMCFVCREYYHKEKLVRIFKKDGELFEDKTLKGGGRGMYLCSLKCLERVRKSKKLNALMKCNVNEEFLNKLEVSLKND